MSSHPCYLSLSSPYIKRVRILDNNELFTLTINGKSIELPLATAVCLSESISFIYSADRLIKSATFNADVNDEKSIEKFFLLLGGNEVDFDGMLEDLFILAQTINNSDIVEMSLSQMYESISPETVLDLISLKTSARLLVDNEIAYAAAHFAFLEGFVEWAINADPDLVERIFRSGHLLLDCEDTLVDIITKICQWKPELVYLFSCVLFEYISIDACGRFCAYIAEHKPSSATFMKIWEAVSVRLMLPVIIKNPMRSRYSKNVNDGKIITSTDIRSGIFVELSKNKSVYVVASSKASGDFLDVISGRDDARFFTEHDEHAWIMVSFPKHSVIPSSYMIRGSIYADNDNQLQTWVLKGNTYDGGWIMLDEHYQEPFHKKEVKVFNVQLSEEIQSFLLERTGITTSGGSRLCISQFEVFGILLDKSK